MGDWSHGPLCLSFPRENRPPSRVDMKQGSSHPRPSPDQSWTASRPAARSTSLCPAAAPPPLRRLMGAKGSRQPPPTSGCSGQHPPRPQQGSSSDHTAPVPAAGASQGSALAQVLPVGASCAPPLAAGALAPRQPSAPAPAGHPCLPVRGDTQQSRAGAGAGGATRKLRTRLSGGGGSEWLVSGADSPSLGE